MNSANFKGWVCQDAQVKYTPTGKIYAYFTIAAPREFMNSEGQYLSDFIPCVLWNERKIEKIAQNIIKGTQIIITGRMQSRTYIDKQENKHYILECIIQTIDFLLHTKNKTNQNETDTFNIFADDQHILDFPEPIEE